MQVIEIWLTCSTLLYQKKYLEITLFECLMVLLLPSKNFRMHFLWGSRKNTLALQTTRIYYLFTSLL